MMALRAALSRGSYSMMSCRRSVLVSMEMAVFMSDPRVFLKALPYAGTLVQKGELCFGPKMSTSWASRFS